MSSLFGQSSAFGGTATSGFGVSTAASTASPANPMKDIEVNSAPDDSISCLRFSPPALSQNTFLIAGSWDNNVRCWEIQGNGASEPKTQQSMQGPVLDACWQDDGSKVFMASCDKQVKCWDLGSNQTVQVRAKR